MEELLILDRPATAEIRQSIESKARIVQEGSDTVLVVQGTADGVREAARLPGVSSARSLPAGGAEKLAPGDRLFVEAWQQRQAAGGEKERVGDGLSWGTKGFEAP